MLVSVSLVPSPKIMSLPYNKTYPRQASSAVAIVPTNYRLMQRKAILEKAKCKFDAAITALSRLSRYPPEAGNIGGGGLC